jgi:hypothetical protein
MIIVEHEIEKIINEVTAKNLAVSKEELRKICFDIYWAHMATLKAFGFKLETLENLKKEKSENGR